MAPVNGAVRAGRRWVLAVRIAARSAWAFRSRAWMAVLLLALPPTVLVAGAVAAWTLTSTPALVQMWLGRDPVVQAEVNAVSAGPITQDLVGSAHTGEDLGSSDTVDVAAVGAAVPEGDTLVPVDVLYGAILSTVPTAQRPAMGVGRETGAVVMQTGDTRVPSIEVPRRGRLGAGEALVPRSVMARTGTQVGDRLEVRVRMDAGRRSDTAGATARIVGSTGDSSAVVVGAGTLAVDRSRVWDRASTTWYVLGSGGLGRAEVRDLNAHGFLVTSRALAAGASSPSEMHPVGIEALSPPGLDPAALTRWPVPLFLLAVLAELVALAVPVATVAQRREAGTLAALSAVGGEEGDRRRVVLAWGTVVGLVAGVLAIPVGVGVAVLLCRAVGDITVLLVPFPLLVPTVLVGGLLGMLVALWPAHEAARMDVVAALAGRPSRGSPLAVRRPWHLLVLVAGFAVQAWAVAGGHHRLFAVGVALVVLGLPRWVSGAMRVSGRVRRGVSLTWGLAMRDAVRQGHRTFPALVSMVWIVFLVSSSLVWYTAQDRAQWASTVHLGAPGQVLVTLTDDSDRDLNPALVASALAAVAQGPGIASTATLRGASDTEATDGVLQVVSAVVPPSRQCPLTAASPAGHAPEWTVLDKDPRCWQMTGSLPVLQPWSVGGLSLAYVVDDGTYLKAAGLLDTARGADALATLRAGGVLVTDPRAVLDGRARVYALTTTASPTPGDGSGSQPGGQVPRLSEELSLPASTWQDLGVMVLSPSAAHRLGLRARPLATLVTTLHPPGVLSADAVSQALGDAAPGTAITVIAPQASSVLVPVGTVVVGVLVILLIVAMVLALALTSTRTGLRALAEVGAGPGHMRRLVLSQGLVLVAHALPVGLVAGVATGLLAARMAVHPTSVLALGAGPQIPALALAVLVGTAVAGTLVVVTALVPHPSRLSR